MLKRKVNILISAIALLVGSILYILFRDNTHIAKLFANISAVDSAKKLLAPLSCNFIKYYFPDFLWCLSLSCGLQAILAATSKGCLLCSGVAGAFGALWECLQYVGVISGTGDLWDIACCFLACGICYILNLEERK